VRRNESRKACRCSAVAVGETELKFINSLPKL
jgi:hypothetical protein